MASRSNRGGPAPSFDNSRRIFRGRGGPTDGRLNKHQARRRKHLAGRDDEVRISKYNDDKEQRVEINEDEAQKEESLEAEEVLDNENEQEISEASPVDVEIQHLLRRARNIRESIQLSAAANSNPSTWQQNVLNSVGNCVGEWRAIVSHYKDDLEVSQCKVPALAMFELIQMALQSGPLAGAKPGYFKRCGSDVARQALNFLNRTVPDKEDTAFLHFSEKQSDTIEKWRDNASKAAENGKPPTKSALKKQTKAKKKQ